MTGAIVCLMVMTFAAGFLIAKLTTIEFEEFLEEIGDEEFIGTDD